MPNSAQTRAQPHFFIALQVAAWLMGVAALSACGGGGDDTITVGVGAATETTGVGQATVLDLNNPLNYSNPTLPVHYDADVMASTNQTPANVVADRGATLGRVLFFDQKLSVNNTVACASCHQSASGFDDPNQFSRGFAGGLTPAHAMRLGNVAFYRGNSMFWNRRANSLEAQATQPIQDATEMGFHAANGGFSALINKMNALPYYPELFTWAFGDATITEARVQNALAQFQRAMISSSSKWDTAYAQTYNPNLPNNNLAADVPGFTADEQRGRRLFMQGPNQGGFNCAACHQPPTFALAPNSGSNGLDAGETTTFKSPSLKNVALSSRFMHDGRFSSLEQVVAHYSSGIQPGTALDRRLPAGGLRMTAQLESDLVAFLRTLTDTALVQDARFSNPFKVQ
jgi:cytochrome c peroxidase